MRIRSTIGWSVAALLAIAAGACSAAKDDTGSPDTSATMGGSGATPVPSAGNDPSGPGNDTGSSAGSGAATDSGGAGSGSKPSGGAGAGVGPANVPDPAVLEMLDPDVDWTALTLVYPTSYSAFDGVHDFKLPIYVDGATVDLSDWSAIPSSAVGFDADPDLGGVIVTVLEDTPEITIAARSGMIGGTASLHITSATPEQWAAGEARYNNGIEFNLPMITPADFAALLLDPNWMPPLPPGDIACNNCHTTGAKYFEIQHTPTQAARFSDDDLRTILTMGKKPPGVGFRVLPEMLGSKTAEEIYAQFHTWDSTEEEIVGLIVYLRSLTPTGQGDILLPDGTYVAPGTAPPGFAGSGG